MNLPLPLFDTWPEPAAPPVAGGRAVGARAAGAAAAGAGAALAGPAWAVGASLPLWPGLGVGGVSEAPGPAAASNTQVAPQSPEPPALADPPEAATLLNPLQLHPSLWRANQVGGGRLPTTATGFATLDEQLPGGGWPHGVLTELLLPRPGVGELRLLAPALARLASGRPVSPAGEAGPVGPGGAGAPASSGWAVAPADPPATGRPVHDTARRPARGVRVGLAGAGAGAGGAAAAGRSVPGGAAAPQGAGRALAAQPTGPAAARADGPGQPGGGAVAGAPPLVAGQAPAEGGCIMLFDPPAPLSAWALLQQGLNPQHWLVVQPRNGTRGWPLLPSADVLWALEQALRSGQVAAVLAWLPLNLRADALRRLQLAAQAHEGPVFLFRQAQAASRPSVAPLRLLLQPAGVDGLQLRLLKRRGPPLAEPLRLQLPPVLNPQQQARALTQQALQGASLARAHALDRPAPAGAVA